MYVDTMTLSKLATSLENDICMTAEEENSFKTWLILKLSVYTNIDHLKPCVLNVTLHCTQSYNFDIFLLLRRYKLNKVFRLFISLSICKFCMLSVTIYVGQQ
jgi:hypothetical protein